MAPTSGGGGEWASRYTDSRRPQDRPIYCPLRFPRHLGQLLPSTGISFMATLATAERPRDSQ